nr:MAG TPA: hypothetical protein [Caudoviricetes sp.]
MRQWNRSRAAMISGCFPDKHGYDSIRRCDHVAFLFIPPPWRLDNYYKLLKGKRKKKDLEKYLHPGIDARITPSYYFLHKARR